MAKKVGMFDKIFLRLRSFSFWSYLKRESDAGNIITSGECRAVKNQTRDIGILFFNQNGWLSQNIIQQVKSENPNITIPNVNAA